MEDIVAPYRVQQIHENDGSPPDRIWKNQEGTSYYDYKTDSQCKVPLSGYEKFTKKHNKLK